MARSDTGQQHLRRVMTEAQPQQDFTGGSFGKTKVPVQRQPQAPKVMQLKMDGDNIKLK